jgi:hypothetical protein
LFINKPGKAGFVHLRTNKAVWINSDESGTISSGNKEYDIDEMLDASEQEFIFESQNEVYTYNFNSGTITKLFEKEHYGYLGDNGLYYTDPLPRYAFVYSLPERRLIYRIVLDWVDPEKVDSHRDIHEVAAVGFIDAGDIIFAYSLHYNLNHDR